MMLLLAWVTLIALVCTSAVAVVRRSVRLLAVVAILGVLWVLDNSPLEGPVRITFNQQHGLTLADLASVAAFGLVAGLLGSRVSV